MASTQDKNRIHSRLASMHNPLLKPLLLVALVLVLPLVLLVLRGESFQTLADRWEANPPGPAQMFAVVVVALASDVFCRSPRAR